MQIIEQSKNSVRRKPSIKEAIAAKMKVLREFYVVNDKNAGVIREQLQAAVETEPGKDYELVLDRVAHTLIARKLGD